MKTRISIIALLSVIAISVWAQNNAPANSKVNDDVIWSTQQRMYSGSQYVGPVYEPFGNTVPSEETEVGSNFRSSSHGGVRKGFGGGAETGQGPSPVGDAVWPMMILLGAYCGFLYVRRKRTLNG